MWTSEITQKEKVNGTLKVIVLYTNDSEKFQETYELRSGGVLETLNSLVYNRLNDLNSVEVDKDKITLGAFTPVLKKTGPLGVSSVST